MRKLSKKQRNEIYKDVQKMFDEKSEHVPFICHCVAKAKGLSYSQYGVYDLKNELPETKLFFDDPSIDIMNMGDIEQLTGKEYEVQKAIVADLLVLMTNTK